jgi:catechol 2,3-dioxygenase-like lactoylglutathione lyase family enzyme
MPAQLNHTVVGARDATESAEFLCQILDLPAPQRMGHFVVVSTDNGVSLDFATVPAEAEVVPQHYAFLIDELEFDKVYDRVVERGLEFWADHRQTRPGEIGTDHGRGFYFLDPSGHYLEVLTEPYTAW